MTGATGRVSDSLAGIERQLKEVWNESSLQARVRARTLNLVAVAGKQSLGPFVELLDQVSQNLSARTLLLTVDPSLPPWHLEGNVNAVCRVSPGGKAPDVCADRIELDLGAVVTQRARSIVETLTDARVPSVLYVGPGAHEAVVNDLAPAMDRIILDSVELGADRAAAVAASGSAHLEDLAFLRLHRWCELTARFFDDPDRRTAVDAIRNVTIGYVAGASAAQAELYVSWLASRLAWHWRNRDLVDAAGRLVRVSLEPRHRPEVRAGSLDRVAIEAGADGDGAMEGEIARTEDPQTARWTLRAGGEVVGDRTFAFPIRQDVDMVCRAAEQPPGTTLAERALTFHRSREVA